MLKRKTLAEKGFKELVRKLDAVFSEFVRLNQVDDNGYVRCITCGKLYNWKNIHNGHFISRSIFATRFNEINCNPQCCHCNSFKQGEWLIYEQRLIEMYGEEKVNELKQIARMGGRQDNNTLCEMIIEYRDKVKTLKREKGL